MRAVLLALMTAVLALIALVPIVSAKEPPAPAPQPPRPYYVIVHPRNPMTKLDWTFLQDAFLKRTKRWPNEKAIHPADLLPSSSVRRRFSEDVIGRSVAAVKSFWQQQIFAGRDVPPPELDTDEKVVAYVLKHEGAVGYVSGTANIGGAKALGVGN